MHFTNSLNVATVKVAELIGYGRVVQIARQMGLGNNIRAYTRGWRWVLTNDTGGPRPPAGYTTFANIWHARRGRKSFATSSAPMARSWKR